VQIINNQSSERVSIYIRRLRSWDGAKTGSVGGQITLVGVESWDERQAPAKKVQGRDR
jgi:hypothetical protein